MDLVKRLLHQKLQDVTFELHSNNEEIRSYKEKVEYKEQRVQDNLKLIAELENALDLLERDDSSGEVQEQQ